MKDPAFPFYAQDFLVGTLHLTCQETGAYIKLLAYQWVNMGIPKQRLGIIMGSGWENTWLAISDKFVEKDGVYFNNRLEAEREKRSRFKEKQAENGKKGGRPRKNPDVNYTDIASETTVNTALKTKKTTPNPTKSQKKPLENENENENDNENNNEIENGKEGMGEKPKIHLPYTSPDFALLWQAWKSYRAQEHAFHYRSAQGEQAALAELATLAQDEAQATAIIHQSMGNGWKGFFELKSNEPKLKNGTSKGRVQYSDDFKRKIAQRLQSG